MKKLMTGNEAVALGAYEAGVKVCTAYPGTPSTEVTENLKGYDDIYVEWSINEKVAVDVAVGASMVGARAIVSMKHQGLNVASDTFQTLGFYGVRGGVVIVVSDDVGCSSSNSEQDNRINAKYACVAMLEPTDSQEAKDFTRLAFRISEELDTPVLLRLTTRVSHSTSLVELTEEREDFTYTGFDKESFKYGIVGALALARHKENIERKSKWVPYSEESPLNRIEWGDTSIGIITSGISYQYVKEVLPSASILKLGFTYPLPRRLIYEFASKVRNLYVVEEGEPYIEEQ
ncbi:MAG: indolepyruvate ferredoxin oxidoreductase subunit alpha, partial [Thermodesulfobacteriota bacterium]|nr:indolepyruvate ferredoxin oxidoreductase subunit alpha [Thermodesulfobacteriota bacterium]